MKAIIIRKPGLIKVVNVPIPKLGPEDVLIRVSAVGICGTDLHILNGDYEASYPIIPGHEFSGIVEEIGEKVKFFNPGDRVTADPNLPCHKCIPCKRGHVNQCEYLEAVGVTRDGAFAQYVVVPEDAVFSIGKMPLHVAAMVEPLACVIWGIKRVQIQPGDSVLIFGAGPMGCLVLQAVKSAGASYVVVRDIADWRLKLANELGATRISGSDESIKALLNCKAGEFDIVVDATGISSVLEEALPFTRPRGKVWVFGVVPPKETIRVIPYEIFRRDLSIIGSFAVNQTFYEAISMIQEKKIKVEPLISHTFKLEDGEKALNTAQNDPRRMKVQIQME